MSGNTIGSFFRVTTWGESHGSALGAIVDGCPPGLALNELEIQQALDRRKPSSSVASTTRKEGDKVEILSGVFEGKTTGTPISLMIRNTDAQSASYDALKDVFRPGQGDFTYQQKYGIRDWRGGGRASGRETAARVAAGAVAAKLLAQSGIDVITYVRAGRFNYFSNGGVQLINDIQKSDPPKPHGNPPGTADNSTESSW